MTEAIKQTASTIAELTSAKSVQALITVLTTIAVLYLWSTSQTVPENLIFAWFFMIGIYVDVPGKKDSGV